MQAHELSPAPKFKTDFISSCSSNIPNQSGCYVLTNPTEGIVYIGKSGDLRKRFGEHLDDPEKVASYFFWLLNNDIDSLEIKWFRQHKQKHGGQIPVLNTQDPSA